MVGNLLKYFKQIFSYQATKFKTWSNFMCQLGPFLLALSHTKNGIATSIEHIAIYCQCYTNTDTPIHLSITKLTILSHMAYYIHALTMHSANTSHSSLVCFSTVNFANPVKSWTDTIGHMKGTK